MLKALWLIPLVSLASCHAQTQTNASTPTIVTSVRSVSILLHPFTIIAVEHPFDARIRCADQEAQKTFHDMRFFAEMVYVGRMIQPGEYYGVSYAECVCEGLVGYEVQRRASEVVVYCKKSS